MRKCYVKWSLDQIKAAYKLFWKFFVNGKNSTTTHPLVVALAKQVGHNARSVHALLQNFLNLATFGRKGLPNSSKAVRAYWAAHAPVDFGRYTMKKCGNDLDYILLNGCK